MRPDHSGLPSPMPAFRLADRAAGGRPGRRLLLPVWASVTLASALAAQTPVVTPAGDPSVRNDSIYALAVDSAKYRSDPFIVLLDDGIVRYEADGRGARTYRQVTQIISPEAVARFAEQQFSYMPGHQRLTVNWLRVVRPDGSVVSEAPRQVQDADVPATLGDPVYTDQKVRRYSLSGVAAGTIVDWSYTLEELKPYRAADFFVSWSVQNPRLTRRSRYILDLPTSMQPHLEESNLNFPRRVTEAHGRRVYVWATQEVPTFERELFAADSNGVQMTIQVSGPGAWRDIGRWYATLAKDRATLSPELTARLPGLVAGAHNADDTLRAIHRWVTRDIRYVSIALGLGGYQPRPSAEVVATGYGDCKDKAMLFVAAATRLGFRAYPVLLNAGGAVDRSLPSINQFNHAIAVIERPGGRQFVDLTADLVPLGELPGSDQGQFGLVVHPDGATEEVTLPEAPPAANLSTIRISGTVDRDGYVTASYEERARGALQYPLRGLFLEPIDSSHGADFARAIATRLFPEAQADSLQTFDGRDLTADPRVSLRIVHGRAGRATANGRTVILTLPFTPPRPFTVAATTLAAKNPRRFPIDAGMVLGPIASKQELTLTLPAGWHALLPPAVDVNGKWGRYAVHYSQEGERLHVLRELEGVRGTYPPDAVTDLIGWLRQVGADDAPYLVIETGGGS